MTIESIFSLNCQIAIQKYIDYYPAFEVSSECKFLKASLTFTLSQHFFCYYEGMSVGFFTAYSFFEVNLN